MPKSNATPKDILNDIVLVMEQILVNASIDQGSPEKWRFVLACVHADLKECLAMIVSQRFEWDQDKAKMAAKKILEEAEKTRRMR